MQTMFRDLRILWRAERIIVETQLRLAARRTALAAAALLIGILGLGMLNFAAYVALAPLWGLAWAAFAVAVADLVVAGLVLLIAGAARPGPEHAAAVELRDMSIQELDTELAPLKNRLSALTRASRGPSLEATLPTLLVPLVAAVLRAVKNKTVG